MRILSNFRLRALGPVAATSFPEAMRSGCGALLALAAIGLITLTSHAQTLGFSLIAPFGASVVLLFAAVNSPLAQPWPVVMGNTISAFVAIVVCTLIDAPLIAAPISVAAAILAMALLRATHPPGGAVALTVALSAAQADLPAVLFVIFPVAAGSILLVLFAIFWARLTGRTYPMRQFGANNPVLTSDPPAVERLGLSEADLRELLTDYRQSLNLGVEDLARLIGAAELRAAGHKAAPSTAADIMSRDLVTVGSDAALEEVAAIFCRHRFTSLPVVSADGRLEGVIFQMDLIAALSRRQPRQIFPWLPQARATAAEIMSTTNATAPEDMPVGALVARLAEKGTDAVMVLSGDRLTGVVTQTDLITALARELLIRPGDHSPISAPE